MSFYIVPKQGDIIAWLNNHYVSSSTMERGQSPSWHRCPQDCLYVCDVNGRRA